VDGSGNVYVTGISDGSGTLEDYATIKYNSSGVQQWVARYNGPGNLNDNAWSLAVDGSGNVYVTGFSNGETSEDYATIKYNSSGVQQWVARYNGPGYFNDQAYSLAVDGSGNVYVTGESRGSGTLEDYATVKYNSSGVQQWVARHNGPGNFYDYASSLAVDGSGNVYVTGISDGSGTGRDYATVKYNSSGVQQWVARYNGPGNYDDFAWSLAVDGSGNVYVTGESYGGTSFDYATIKYNSSGVQQWVARYGPENSFDGASSLAVDGSGNVYVTGNSSSGTLYDYATIKYSQQSQPLLQPSISVSPIQINPGGNVNITGQNFRASAQVKVSIISSNSELVHDQVYTTNLNGGFNASYSSNVNSTPGIYTVTCRDIFTNQTAQNKTFEILEQIQSYDISILSPSSAIQNPDTVNLKFNVQWQDKMFKANGYSITGSKRHYKYHITLSTDGGVLWNDTVIVEGDEQINSMPIFNREVQINTITNSSGELNVKAKVTDMIQSNRNKTTGTIPVRLNQLTKSKASFVWDFSYPERSNPVVGVCADGVSRFYIKLKKEPGSHTITSVHLQLSDELESTSNRHLGKLMIANVTDRYNIEANSAIHTTINDSRTSEELWYWYVSPDDFVRNDNADDKSRMLRQVRVKINVHYSIGNPESETRVVNIVRPPLVLVHGFAGDPGMWDEFKRDIENMFISKFVFTPRIKTNRSFDQCGEALLNQNQRDNFEDDNSLPGIIIRARRSGYACNQVYYIGHSMGGCIIRAAAKKYYYKSYLNYSMGFVNRLITLDTPHQGSPIADLITNFYYLLDYIQARSLRDELIYDHGNRDNDLGRMIRSGFDLDRTDNSIHISGSLRNLQAAQAGRYIFTNNNIRSYLIAGDFFPGSSNLNNLNWDFSYGIELHNFVDWINDFLPYTLSTIHRSVFYKWGDGNLAFEIFLDHSKNRTEKAFRLLDLMCNKILGTEAFLANSDLVVTVKSQLAGKQSFYSVNTFDKFQTNDPNSLGIGHTFFNSCYEAQDVKAKVKEVLNYPGNSTNFLYEIPETPSTNPILGSLISNGNSVNNFSIDSNRYINILSPVPGEIQFVDSSLIVNFTISDTAKLKFVSLYFQGEQYIDTSSSFAFSFNIPVSSNELDSCIVNVFAVYSENDSMEFSNEYRKVYVQSNALPMELRVTDDVINMAANDTVKPEYRTVFQSFIHDGNLSDISATIENPSIVSFNSINKSFQSLASGETSAIVSIGSVRDTIYFNVFSQVQLPGITILNSPYDSAIVSSSGTKFSWMSSSNAATYLFQISKDFNFESIVYEENSLSDTFAVVPLIEDSIIYYWRVQALNISGSGDWSSTRNFTAVPIKNSYLYVNLIQQGFYNLATQHLNRKDTAKAYLVNISPPYNIVDSSVSIIDSVSFQGLFEFKNTPTGTYFIKVTHLNSIETWSKIGGEYFKNHDKMYFDFTKSQNQAFGDNQILIGPYWCIYSGDVNQDGTVDATDLSAVDNDAANFISGYVSTDLTGDGFVDGTDFAIADNNAASFVSVVRP